MFIFRIVAYSLLSVGMLVCVTACSDSGTLLGGSCSTASDCPSGQICDTASSECTLDIDCTTNADCGFGAICSGQQCQASTVGSVCDSNADCLTGYECIGGFCGCEGDQFLGLSEPPQMMLALDRSHSMLFNLDSDYLPGQPQIPDNFNYNPPIRWDSAEPAVNSLLSSFENKAEFGLMMYPLGGYCNVPDSAVVAPGLGQASAIQQALVANEPLADQSGTPIKDTVQKVLDGLIFTSDPTKDNFLVLVTDGEPTCGDQDVDILNIVGQLAAQTPPIHTYAIGFGGGGIDVPFLNQVAAAGKTGQAYLTTDQASLQAAFDALLRSSLSCEYTVSSNVTLDQLVVVVGDQPVAEDAVDGWTFNTAKNAVEFHGAACDSLRSGAVESVTVLTGCLAAPD